MAQCLTRSKPSINESWKIKCLLSYFTASKVSLLLPYIDRKTEGLGGYPLTQVRTASKSGLSVRTPSSVDCQGLYRNTRPGESLPDHPG